MFAWFTSNINFFLQFFTYFTLLEHHQEYREQLLFHLSPSSLQRIFLYFFLHLDGKLLGFLIFFVGYTPRPKMNTNFQASTTSGSTLGF